MDDACPTKEAIRALFKTLLDPLLPSKPNDDPDESLRESVAKQVYAVLVLYNYHHRRDNPHLESLSFVSFCSLATSMRPALLQHFNDNDPKKTMLMDKGIVQACRLSMSLNASPDLSMWPIRKVAVLLVDSDKMNCYLQHSFITQGVWSLLETSIGKQKAAMEKKEVAFQKVAFVAIKEATGINQKDIVILEKHLVRSLSEEKTAVRFYIMKCSSKDRVFPKVPIEKVIKSMQGPLFEKTISEWVTTDKVGYFHVLPYASFIEDWFARRGVAESSIEKEPEAVRDNIARNRKENATKETEVSNKNDEVKGKKVAALPRRKATQNRYESTSIMKETDLVLGLRAPSVNSEIYEKAIQRNKDLIEALKTVAEKEEIKKNDVPQRRRSERKRKTASSSDNNSNIEELQMSLLSKATDISKTAMNVLVSKRDKLISQQKDTEAEIVKCDNLIQNIEGNWEMQLETILEYCNETCLKETPEDKAVPQRRRSSRKRKTASSNIEELQMSLLSKATDISKTAMNVLLSKRDKLISQQKDIEEEIAKCDNLIQNINGNWEMQLATILEHCNETCLKESPEKSTSKRSKRRKISETVEKLDEAEVRIIGNHDDLEDAEFDAVCGLTELKYSTTANLG